MSQVSEEQIEQELIKYIFKYREILQKRQYLSIQEREDDRQRLNELYGRLHSVKQKILDSKCYFQLAEIQKELTALFLADETTAQERLKMMAYVVRCVCHPIVFLHCRCALTQSLAIRGTQEQKDLISDSKSTPQFCSSFKTISLSYEEIAEMKVRVKSLLYEGLSGRDLEKRISLSQAEILSQLAADEEAPLTVEVLDKEKANLPTTVILKEA